MEESLGKYDRDTILKDLRRNVIEVHFIKENGEQRVMKCTLQKHMLPERYAMEDEKEERDFHVKNPQVVAAWSINDGGWRSFRVESVYYVQAVDVAN